MRSLQVVVPTPLPGTFGRAELEYAAALLVRTLQVLDRPWGPVLPHEIDSMLDIELAEAKAAGKRHPWDHPFFRPDFDGLIEAGFARWIEQEGLSDRFRPIEFTTAGLEMMVDHGGDRDDARA